jgi:hypothetical protein
MAGGSIQESACGRCGDEAVQNHQAASFTVLFRPAMSRRDTRRGRHRTQQFRLRQ